MQDIFEKLIVTQLGKRQPALLVEPEGSPSCSQNPIIGPYPEPEPAESSLSHRALQ